MESIKYIVFDYNGTLTNDALIGYESCNHMLRFYKVPEISFERFKETFTTPWINFYIVNGVQEKNVDLKKHQDEYQKIHTKLAKTELKLNDGVVELLELLKSKGKKIGILSSRNVKDLTDELVQLGVFDYFDAVVGESHIYEDGIRAEKQVEALLKKLDITNPFEVLYVGDMIPDIKIAREHGFVSGVIPTGWQSEEKLVNEKPDYIFRTFSELSRIFKE